MADAGTTHRVPGLFLRLAGALFAIATYVLVRDELGPAGRVAARFGLGITLFALLIDLGRAAAGASAPLLGTFRPHRQRAEALVDDDYRDIHTRLRRFLDDGDYDSGYEQLMRAALEERGVVGEQAEVALQEAERSARDPPPSPRPILFVIAGGTILVLGSALALGVVLEAAQVPLTAPLLLMTGFGLVALQARTVGLRHRAGTAVVGLTGALLVYLGATGLAANHDTAWGAFQWIALLLAGATLALVLLLKQERPAWHRVRATIEHELLALRRAFVATLLAGVVLFPVRPVLAALFDALGWSLEAPYRIAVIGFVTLALFLGIELAGAWTALAKGDRQARKLREARLAANDRLFALLEGREITEGGRAA